MITFSNYECSIADDQIDLGFPSRGKTYFSEFIIFTGSGAGVFSSPYLPGAGYGDGFVLTTVPHVREVPLNLITL